MSIDYRKTKFFMVASKVEECPAIKLPEIVLAGRSNVGKSSFINALGDNKGLAKVSSTPGKTKLVVYFVTDNSILFSDLPGYGYAKLPKEKKKEYQNLVDNYFNSGRDFSFVIHFMDIRHSPSEHDRLMKHWMEENNCKYFIVLSKSDKLSKLEISKKVAEVRADLTVSADIPIIAMSATNKSGIKEIKGVISSWVASEKQAQDI